MPENIEQFLSLALFVNLIVALLFVLRAKTKADKILITLLLGTTGVAFLLLLYADSKEESLIDTALVFMLLASVAATVFARGRDR